VNLKEDQFIRAGYSANASIVLESRDSVIVIPEGLLKFENDSAYVEIELDSQVFEKRWVEVGLSDGLNIEVLEGLDLTDKIKGAKIDPKELKQMAKDKKAKEAKAKEDAKSTEDETQDDELKEEIE
jgi:HlyD family secretion protein